MSDDMGKRIVRASDAVRPAISQDINTDFCERQNCCT